MTDSDTRAALDALADHLAGAPRSRRDAARACGTIITVNNAAATTSPSEGKSIASIHFPRSDHEHHAADDSDDQDDDDDADAAHGCATRDGHRGCPHLPHPAVPYLNEVWQTHRTRRQASGIPARTSRRDRGAKPALGFAASVLGSFPRGSTLRDTRHPGFSVGAAYQN